MKIHTWIEENGEKYAAVVLHNGHVAFASQDVPVFGFTSHQRTSVPDKSVKYFVQGAVYSQMFVWYNLKKEQDLYNLLISAARLQDV